MDDDVVGGVEGARVVVVEECGCFMWSFRFHIDEARGFAERALRAEDDAVAVVGAAIGHVIAFWTANFVSREVRGGEEFYLCNHDCFVAGCDGVWGRVFELIGGYEEGIRRGVEDTSFVEEGGAGVIDEELKSRILAEEGEERVMVDEEGFRLRRRRGDDGLSVQKSEEVNT